MIDSLHNWQEIEAVLARLSEEDRKVLLPALTIDPLTGVLNRTTFFRELRTQLHRAEHNQEPLVYAVADIDNFKAYQDAHEEGHLAGDRVLRQVAQTIKNHVKDYDLVGRLGGEELGIVFLDVDLTEGLVAAERVRAEVQNSCPVTLSIGLSEYIPQRTEALELIATADRVMYRAKESGRNRIVAYKE